MSVGDSYSPGLEGVVAKRRRSFYEPGRRSGTTSRLATSVAKSGRPEDLRYRAAV